MLGRGVNEAERCGKAAQKAGRRATAVEGLPHEMLHEEESSS